MLIAIDWGTTRLRAYLVDAGGVVRDRSSAPLGILGVPNGNFEQAFEDVVGPWLQREGDLPTIAAGMIGSRQGWLETPYVQCPVGPGDLAANLARLDTGSGRRIWFVPGMRCLDADGIPDVARGEETQIVGDPAFDSGGSALMVLPGTHSKWALVRDRRIVWFATFMTGEVFAALCDHTILGRLMQPGAEDRASFGRGVAYAAAAGAGSGGFLKRIFSARTLVLAGQLPGSAARSYLSGLLIGSEIGEAMGCVGAMLPDTPDKATLIGSAELSALYAEALSMRAIACETRGEDAAARGLHRIAVAAKLIGA